MGIISLEGLEFFAYHGFHKEERKLGNKFTVDIQVEADLEEAAATDDLSKTVDYVSLYQVVSKEMARPAHLLEKIAKNIITDTFSFDPRIQSVEVCVTKYNPPMGGICRKARVILKEKK
ncbi:MAG TPA: dihydroneopterin aldolase [Cytophagales bacterium]|nr:dihydroneopterin aldolase [Cytophagales bacterium]